MGNDDVAMASLSYKAKVGGVPFEDKNMPIQAPVDPGTAANLKMDWTLDLTIVENPAAKGPSVAASAVLTLPNGDTIQFPQKKAKFSVKKGFKLSFKKGTNTTLNPPAVDKKTKIKIVGLTFTGNGPFVVTGGTINYKFLGQKGVADLFEFTQP